MQVALLPMAKASESDGISLGTIQVERKYAKKEIPISPMLRFIIIRETIERGSFWVLHFLAIWRIMNKDPTIETKPDIFGKIAIAVKNTDSAMMPFLVQRDLS